MSTDLGNAASATIGLYACRGWKATLDTPTPWFQWVVATGGDGSPITICVEGSAENEITPIKVLPCQPFMIKGKCIKTSGNDRYGNSFTTTAGIEVLVYGGTT